MRSGALTSWEASNAALAVLAILSALIDMVLGCGWRAVVGSAEDRLDYRSYRISVIFKIKLEELLQMANGATATASIKRLITGMARCDIASLVATLHATSDNIICIPRLVCWNTRCADGYLDTMPYKPLQEYGPKWVDPQLRRPPPIYHH